MATGRSFEPPKPVGEPFRGDPNGAAPFLTEDDKVPVVPVEPAAPADFGPAYGHPPSHSPEYGQPPSYGQGPGAEQPGGPVFRAPGKAQAQVRPPTPDERFARVALWVSIASVFVFNVILGPIAFVMGVMAIRRGEKRLGQLAMLLGGIGTALGIAIIVLVSTGVLDMNELLRDLRNGK